VDQIFNNIKRLNFKVGGWKWIDMVMDSGRVFWIGIFGWKFLGVVEICQNFKRLINSKCVGYFQNGLKPFSCYVKISYLHSITFVA
jgi:hypothetical protein